LKLVRVLEERCGVLADISRDQMIGHRFFQKIEPEDRKLCKHDAFARYGVRQNDIESRDAVGGND